MIHTSAITAFTVKPSHVTVSHASGKVAFRGGIISRGISTRNVEIPKPIVPPVKSPEVQAQGPAPPPPPPPSNLIFYGFATPQGGVKRIFLTKNEDVFIAKEGDIVDRRYKVVKISPNSVEILDVLSNNRENLPLRQG